MQRIIRWRLTILPFEGYRAEITLWDNSVWIGWGETPAEAEDDAGLCYYSLSREELYYVQQTPEVFNLSHLQDLLK